MTYTVEITQEALEMLAEIEDRRVRRKVFDRIRELERDPEKQGKALVDSLAGYRSVRAVGQRYRIVYAIEEQAVKVIVVAAGIRKDGSRQDVYQQASKQVRKARR